MKASFLSSAEESFQCYWHWMKNVFIYFLCMICWLIPSEAKISFLSDVLLVKYLSFQKFFLSSLSVQPLCNLDEGKAEKVIYDETLIIRSIELYTFFRLPSSSHHDRSEIKSTLNTRLNYWRVKDEHYRPKTSNQSRSILMDANYLSRWFDLMRSIEIG